VRERGFGIARRRWADTDRRVGFVIAEPDGTVVGANLGWEDVVADLPFDAADGEAAVPGGNLRAWLAECEHPAAETLSTALREAADGDRAALRETVGDGDASVRITSVEPDDLRYLVFTVGVERSPGDGSLRESAMDEAPVGISISDPSLPDNPVIYANAAFERITGYDREEVVGRNCRFLQGPDTDEEAVARLRESIAAGTPVSVELLNYHKSGEAFWNEVTLAPITDDEGAVTNYVGFQQDVTDRKEAELELERERDRYALLNQIVRHDIRNDMSVVVGWVDQLREHVDVDGEKLIERVLSAAKHTEQLTEEVGNLAAVIGGDDPELEEVDLAAAVREEVARVTSTFEYRSGRVAVTAEGVDDPLPVRATPLLSSVVGNLLDNAVFHNDRAAVEVAVTVERDADTAAVRIADNGPGIPDRQKRTIFDRGEKNLESSGSGLGLHLVDQLVGTFGGTVWVEDNEPRGAVFCVTLPLAE